MLELQLLCSLTHHQTQVLFLSCHHRLGRAGRANRDQLENSSFRHGLAREQSVLYLLANSVLAELKVCDIVMQLDKHEGLSIKLNAELALVLKVQTLGVVAQNKYPLFR